jgi:hypothetical protein
MYLLGESIAAAALMHGGDRLCRVAKYLFTGVIGIWLIAEAKQADVMHLVMALALALFVLKNTLERIKKFIDELLENGHA